MGYPLFLNKANAYTLDTPSSAAPITVANCAFSGRMNFTSKRSSNFENTPVIAEIEVRFPVRTTFLSP